MLLKVILTNLFSTLVIAHKQVKSNSDTNSDQRHYYGTVHQDGNTHQYYINHGPNLPTPSRLVANHLDQNGTKEDVDESGKQRVNIWSAPEEIISSDPVLSKTKQNNSEDDAAPLIQQSSYGSKRKAKNNVKPKQSQNNQNRSKEVNRRQYESTEYSLYDADFGSIYRKSTGQEEKFNKDINNRNKREQRPQHQTHSIESYEHDYYSQGQDETQNHHSITEKNEEIETVQNSWNPIPSKNGPYVSKFTIGTYKNQLNPTADIPIITTIINSQHQRQSITNHNIQPKIENNRRNITRHSYGPPNHYYELNPSVYEQATHHHEGTGQRASGAIENDQKYLYTQESASEKESADEDVKYMPVLTQQEYDKYERYLAIMSPEEAYKMLDQSNQVPSNGWKATEHAGQLISKISKNTMDIKKYNHYHQLPTSDNGRNPEITPNKRTYPYRNIVIPLPREANLKYNPKILVPPENIQYNYKPQLEAPVLLKDVEFKLPIDSTNSVNIDGKIVILKCLINSRTSVHCEIMRKPDELRDISNGDVLKQMKDTPYIYEYIHPLINNPELLPKVQDHSVPFANTTEAYYIHQPMYYTQQQYQYLQESQNNPYLPPPKYAVATSGKSQIMYAPAPIYSKVSNEPKQYLKQKVSTTGQYGPTKHTRTVQNNIKRTHYPSGPNSKKVLYTNN